MRYQRAFAVLGLVALVGCDIPHLTMPSLCPDASCGDGGGGGGPVTTLAVIPSSATMHPGDTLRLEAHYLFGGADTGRDSLVTWSSWDTTLARVDGTGLVTALAVGSVDIAATDSALVTTGCRITIVGAGSPRRVGKGAGG